MVRAKILTLAGAAALVSTASLAADLPPPLLPPPPAPVVVTGGWYLRGDIGLGRDVCLVQPQSWRSEDVAIALISLLCARNQPEQGISLDFRSFGTLCETAFTQGTHRKHGHKQCLSARRRL